MSSKNLKSSDTSKTPKTASGTKITGPTVLTIMRMFLAIIFLILALTPTLPTHLLALIVFIVASITDLIDGKWARRRHKVTDLGAFLDPLADKMLTSLAFLALVGMQIIPLWIFAIILVRDFAVDGMRMMAAREGVTIAASKWGKWKTTFQLTALIIFLANLVVGDLSVTLLANNAIDGLGDAFEPLQLFFNTLGAILTIFGNIVLYIALFLTIISGLDYLIKNWHKVIKDDTI